MATKIVLFNHKGGVSKTTTTYNLGWMLASLGHKVLLVDADPQCNLTSLILGDDFEKYYFDESTQFHNIKDGVKVAFQGKPKTIEAVNCFSPSKNKNLFLLAGHTELSEYESVLGFIQNSNNAIYSLGNLVGVFDKLISKTAEHYNVEYVLIDLSLGLNAINQNIFICTDMFAILFNPDPFAIMAVSTLANILPRWVDWADRMRPLFEDATYPLSQSRPKFIGEIIQRFNIRKGKAAMPYRDNIQEIKQTIYEKLVPELNKHQMLFTADAYKKAGISNDDYCLLELKNFQGLLPKAHNADVPVFALSGDDISESGIVLDGLIKNRNLFKDEFSNLANKIIALNNYANGSTSI